MKRAIVNGGETLKGNVYISGSKNASIAIIAACLLVNGEIVLDNVPRVNDVNVMLNVAESIGVKYKWVNTNQLSIDCSDLNSSTIGYNYSKELHASILFLGPLVGRFGESSISLPGNDNLGPRPVDLHLKGFNLKGIHADIENGQIKVIGHNKRDSKIYLDYPSVGATENLILNSVLGDCVTVIEGAAKDPEIVNMASFLTFMGAKIRGAGTDSVKIKGVSALNPVRYTIMPDRMEAGTFMIMAATNRNDITLNGIVNRHLKPVTAKIREAGAEVIESEGAVRVIGAHRLKSINVKATPYPGFPTDLQPTITAVLTTALNTSIISEKVFKSRFQHIGELRRLGAKIKVEGNTAVISGIEKLLGASVNANDSRGAAALITAGLLAHGKTEISNAQFIDNGYESWLEKLTALKADVKLV
ncbi:MAG: hypothetical protein APF76_00720 [Desulfitibacter sp. BRH_c19]|nr:MAG: hypothetical protein APF76_00720 [Desulfitibacter sp. BRH_c19]